MITRWSFLVTMVTMLMSGISKIISKSTTSTLEEAIGLSDSDFKVSSILL